MFRIAGIVAEYNPFHNGHAWMVRQLRQQGYNAVVCVMSGPLVQRAEGAFFPTHVRAEAALAGGVDLVLRLPMPWACATAQVFCTAGAGALAALGCVHTLAFGAELADTGHLEELAAALDRPAFSAHIKAELARGISFAAARANAAEQILPGAAAILNEPNNILGVEYCRALQTDVPQLLQTLAGGAPPLPVPLALPRKGAAHDGLPQEGVASASWLRAQAGSGGIEALQGWVPSACLPIYQRAGQAGFVSSPSKWDIALMSRLRGKTLADIEGRQGAGDGLAQRLAAAIGRGATLQEVYALAKTKRFAHSRIRRVALATALQLPPTLPALPPFLHVLAANTRGLALLKKAKQTALLPLSTSLAKLARTGPEAARFVATEALGEDLYALCQQTPQPGGTAFTRPAILVKKED